MPLAEVNGTTLHYRFDGHEHGAVVMLSDFIYFYLWGIRCSLRHKKTRSGA